MAHINPYEPPGLNQDRKRFGVPAWLTSLVLYWLTFEVSMELVAVGPSSLLWWFDLSPGVFALYAFCSIVHAVPIFFIGHLIISSKSKTETICRALVAGTAFALWPSHLVRLKSLIYWLRDHGLDSANVLLPHNNIRAFNLLIALLIELSLLAAWRAFWYKQKPPRIRTPVLIPQDSG